MFSLLGTIYKKNSAPAFAIFTFVQSLGSAVAFYYSNYANLHVHVFLLIFGSTFSTLALLKVHDMTTPKPIKEIEKIEYQTSGQEEMKGVSQVLSSYVVVAPN